ncbi:unnamed protein product [Chilo suppressalis]|uniref:F-box domain-containing protein n=1 Tax=Chilo suppressalis TaxID=168631 RepID=A0ABN8BCA2_CHISP|nr:unnamed protein product [Chilo suppressalis]
MMVNSENSDWDYCPSEILLLIFKYLDNKSLFNCMTVNKRWFCLVSTTARRTGWENMVKFGISDSGASFRKKSKLESRDIIINHCLWQNIEITSAVCQRSYELDDLLNINVYKGALILVGTSNVSYYDIESNALFKTSTGSYADYDENDYMISALQKCDYLKILNLSPKRDPHSYWDDTDSQAFTVPLYKIHDDCCYVTTTDRCLFALKWTEELWDWKLLARHYGHGVIVDINVYQDEVYVMLNWGGLLKVDRVGLKFQPGYCFDIPKYSNPMLYQKYGAIIPVSNDSPFKMKYQDSEHWVLECPGLTCTLEHGDMLMLGYEDGKVEIYEPRKMKCPEPKPILSLNVQQFAKSYDTDNVAVLKLEVSEAELSHDLFIATKSTVYQIKLDHDESIRNCILNECK